MKEIRLDKRLQSVADFVRKNTVFADIGTDHAYLPTYLLQKGIIKTAIASDINELPLKSAKSTVASHGVEDFVTLKLCSGLDTLENYNIRDIAIAGMGGEMIAEIIDKAKWVKTSEIHLILQPMSKAYDLRKYLCANGFEIIEETASEANNKCYTTILASYSGEIIERPQAYFYIGKLFEKQDDTAKKYKLKQYNSLIKRANGLNKAKKYDDAEEISATAEKIKENIK